MGQVISIPKRAAVALSFDKDNVFSSVPTIEFSLQRNRQMQGATVSVPCPDFLASCHPLFGLHEALNLIPSPRPLHLSPTRLSPASLRHPSTPQPTPPARTCSRSRWPTWTRATRACGRAATATAGRRSTRYLPLSLNPLPLHHPFLSHLAFSLHALCPSLSHPPCIT